MASPERFNEVMEMVDRAYEVPPEERPALLDGLCRGDRELRREVESLLDHDAKDCEAVAAAERGDGADIFAAKLIADTVSEGGPTSTQLPDRIGPYRIVGKIGQGGMGIVYEAEQDHPRRRVALKVLSGGAGHAQLLRRFHREANVLGSLHHAGIAQVYEAGVAEVRTDSGMSVEQPFFAMELVDGQPLDEYARKHDLDHSTRLDLIAKICDAVHHAHEHGVIHRDLKPGNVLVDSDGQPKVLDFGVSRATNADVQTVTLKTDIGQLIGTIPYMSPEQCAGDPAALDARSDVYSLGVVLYELLAHRLPYELRNRPIPDAIRVIQEQDPSRLSSIDRTFRGDIETIVGKSLEKEKERRYQSAAQLAADIRRYLSDEPLVARPASTFYQMRKFASRNTVLVGGIAATVLAIVVGAAFSIHYAINADRNAERALEREGAALRAEANAMRAVYQTSIVAASSAIDSGAARTALAHLDAAPEHLRGWEWRHLKARVDPVLARRPIPSPPHRSAVQDLPPAERCAFLPDGTAVAAWALDTGIELVELGSGNVRARFEVVGALLPTLSEDGSRLACFLPRDNAIAVWDVADGTRSSHIALSREGSAITQVVVLGGWQSSGHRHFRYGKPV